MVDQDKYCIDVLIQVSRPPGRCSASVLGPLDGHLSQCVLDVREPAGLSSRASEGSIRRDRPARPQ